MDPARFARIRQVFEDGLELQPAARAAFLGAACGGDATLRADVERMLAAHDAEERTGTAAPPATGELLAALAGVEPLHAGARLGTWRLLAPLGAGGMGEVWEAEQSQPRRHAALKVVRAGPSGTRARLRFRDEIDALARLQHPGIARILEAGGGEDGERLWYAMELVPGARPLTVHARGLPWRQRVELLCATCDAVEHGHRNGVIHRDLKPANIVVGDDGRPRVIDFGVARLSGPDGCLDGRTQAGELVGTLACMAPEQLDGYADVRTDVYALGVVLHELLTGRLPHELKDVGLSEALRCIREESPPPPRAQAPELPVELDWIVARALEKDPEQRYPTAGALADDLRHLLADEPVQAGAPTAWYRLRKFVRRHRVGVALGLLILLLLLGGSAGTLTGMLRAQRKAQEALEARASAEESAAEAQAVTQFLVDMFDRADPDQDGSEVRVIDALDAAEASLGGFLAEHPRAEATVRGALGSLDFKLGRFGQAESQLRRALEVQRARGLVGPEAESALTRLRHELGQVLGELGRFDEAEAELQAVVAARRLGDLPALANALNSLAFLRQRKGDAGEAEALYREALEIALSAGAAGRVDAARVRGNLGGLLLERRRHAEAEPLLAAALDTLRTELGPDHPLAITALNNLGGVRFQQNRFAEAASVMQEVYDLRRRRLPADHPVLLLTRANLATLHWALGENDEAVRLTEEVLAARLKDEPAWNPELVTMLCNLSNFVRPRGDDAVRDVVARVVAASVGGNAETLRSVAPLDNFGHYLEAWELWPEALAIYEEAAAARARLDQPDSSASLCGRACRARMLAAAGREDEARAELDALDITAGSLWAADDPSRGLLNLECGRAWLRLGELPRAEAQLEEAAALLAAQQATESLRECFRMLADLCDATGRAAQAATWVQRLAALSSGEAPR